MSSYKNIHNLVQLNKPKQLHLLWHSVRKRGGGPCYSAKPTRGQFTIKPRRKQSRHLEYVAVKIMSWTAAAIRICTVHYVG